MHSRVCITFVRSLRAGVQPTLDSSAATIRIRIGRCVRCVLETCRVKEGLSRSEQLVGYFYSSPLLDVAYSNCLA